MTQVSQRITQLSAVLLVLTLGLGLVLPKIAGFGFLALSLTAIVWLTWNRAWFDGQLIALERLFVAFLFLFVLIWVVAWWGHGLSQAGFDGIGRVLRLALIIPLFLFVRRVDGLDRAWWMGLIVGGCAAGGFAWWFFLSGQTATFESRVEGATNPIYFGGISLAIAVMLLAKLSDQDQSRASRGWVLIAIVLAFCASLLSGSRGAWLALIPMMGLYVLTLGRRQPPRWRFGLPLIAGLGAVLVLITPSIPTSERFVEGFYELSQLSQGEMTEGALGRRWHMWSMAFGSMHSHWLTGIGPGEFASTLQQAIERGEASELMADYTHPHNQYLSALTDAGIVLMLILVLLLATAARRFYRLWSSGLQRTRELGWAGLSAVVLLAVMALSESIFERNAGVVWFGLLTAGSMGLVHAQRRRELAKAREIEHKQRLSVIIITLNEADRIESCLTALRGWADEIIVLDSGSQDGTPELARQFTEHVHETDWPGYGRQKQRALDLATGDWVLSIDADEVVSEDLKAEIDWVLAQGVSLRGNEVEFDAYTLPWVTHAFGQTLQHGRWSRTPLRLIQKGAGRFSDAPVHESLVLARGKKAGHLEGALHHRPYRDLKHARAKLDGYAQLQASVRAATHQYSGSAWVASLRAGANFLDNYILRAAMLDGRAGWTLSVLMARYTFQKYRRLKSSQSL